MVELTEKDRAAVLFVQAVLRSEDGAKFAYTSEFKKFAILFSEIIETMHFAGELNAKTD